MSKSDMEATWRSLDAQRRQDVLVALTDAEQRELREAARAERPVSFAERLFARRVDRAKASANARKTAEAFSIARRLLERLTP